MPKRFSKESSSNTHLFAAPRGNNTNFGFDSEFVIFFDNEFFLHQNRSLIYLTCTTLQIRIREKGLHKTEKNNSKRIYAASPIL